MAADIPATEDKDDKPATKEEVEDEDDEDDEDEDGDDDKKDDDEDKEGEDEEDMPKLYVFSLLSCTSFKLMSLFNSHAMSRAPMQHNVVGSSMRPPPRPSRPH